MWAGTAQHEPCRGPPSGLSERHPAFSAALGQGVSPWLMARRRVQKEAGVCCPRSERRPSASSCQDSFRTGCDQPRGTRGIAWGPDRVRRRSATRWTGLSRSAAVASSAVSSDVHTALTRRVCSVHRPLHGGITASPTKRGFPEGLVIPERPRAYRHTLLPRHRRSGGPRPLSGARPRPPQSGCPRSSGAPQSALSSPLRPDPGRRP
jgi:hypothetical protein